MQKALKKKILKKAIVFVKRKKLFFYVLYKYN